MLNLLEYCTELKISVISLHFVRQALEAELLTLKGRAEEMEQQLADAQEDRRGTRARIFLLFFFSVYAVTTHVLHAFTRTFFPY